MLRTSRKALAVCLLAAGLVIGASAAGAMAKDGQSLEGPIVSVSSSTHTFKINDHHKGKLTIKVNSSTKYHNLSGFKALHDGLKVDVEARHSNAGWIAIKIEPKHH